MFCIGFDIGGTKIEASLFSVDDKPKVEALQTFEAEISQQKKFVSKLFSKRVATERQLGYEHILTSMVGLVRDVCFENKIEISQLGAIGLALPGSVNPQTQMMISGNTMAFISRPIATDLAAALKVDKSIVSCANDANCFALAEALCGAGIVHAKKTKTSVSEHVGVGIILGTGTGGGIVVRSQILDGWRGGGAELGHTILFPNGHPCYCGRSGCAEQYLSGPGLEAAFASRRYSQVQGFPNAAEIFAMAINLDPVAIAIVDQYKRHLGQFLGQLTAVLDPDYFVLGGGVSKQNAIYIGLSQIVAANTFLPDPLIPIYKHQVGDSSGALGAVLNTFGRK